ncbi:hypothetical protein SAMN06298224_2276 [Fibrobacter sp. UWB16]|uniref:hypothetical protein n=1 Tax=unclassified Fibrobacter TaxID=2634177 RepID=UPI000B524864|nr:MULTISPECIES: hypothetical protein [unclassified Fibrobacter]OWV19304.1 hypothetical protein B7991_08620 [Fibrobacter sp. UWB3]SOD15878.1 hypothetical protein SAMN06298224_2276 [Fibrobacter sp. UWB16]
MNKKLIALTFAASLFAACGSDSSNNASSDSDDYKREFATSISTGETMFIGTMSLDHTDDLGKDFVEVGTRAGVVYYDNSLFIADLDVGSISRYSLAENNKLGKVTAKLSLPGTWVNHIYFVNDEKAYLGGMLDSLIIINPKTMKKTGAIDLSKYKDKDALVVSPGTGVIVDDRLYVGLLQNVSDYATGNEAQVAIIDIKKDKVIDVAKDDRIAAVGSLDDSQNQAFIVLDGYIYCYSNASWGYAPGQVDGFLRIKVGETKFDEKYVWKVSEEVGIKNLTEKGNFKYLSPATYPSEDGYVYAFLNVMVDLQQTWTDMDSYHNNTCKPVQVDLAKKKIKALPIGYSSSWASYGKYVEDDGNVIFAVSTEENGNAYFRYDPKTDKAKKIAKAEQIPMWIVPLK